MSPQIILILMFSSSAILIVLLFVVRRKKNTTEKPHTAVTSTQKNEIKDINSASNEKSNRENDLIELVKRHNFFKGKNLEKFKEFLLTNEYIKIETLIREKFQAQGKENAAKQAKKVSKKLLGSLMIDLA